MQIRRVGRHLRFAVQRCRLLGSILLLCLPVRAAAEVAAEGLAQRSLAELADIEVTSASKAPDRLRSAAATIHVITREDIRRSGATILPEALRLAPNLLVSQLSSSNYVIAARGFSGNTGAQNFANKILLLIDGRSVYSPLFSGIYTDANDVLLEDVDRIEVISGAGATLWGANAMNGVINVITRQASATEGGLAIVRGGDFEQNLAVRYGTRLSDEASLRLFGKGLRRDATELLAGGGAEDDWYKGQAGLRLDWQRAAGSLTVLADTYRALERKLDSGKETVSGASTLARWSHAGETNALQVQAYFDRSSRAAPGDSGFTLNTYDVEVQDTLTLMQSHRLVLGMGQRFNEYVIHASPGLSFRPDGRTLSITNVFAQDTIALSAAVAVTLGLKLEKYTFSDWQLQPDARLTWMPSGTATVWMAASRAVRAPTPFEHDVVEKVAGQTLLVGNPHLAPEVVKSVEVGFRGAVHGWVTTSISAYYNRYDDLRTVEPDPRSFLPLSWRNGMQGSTYGMDAWATLQLANWWRVAPGVGLLRKNLAFKQGAVRLVGVQQAGNDPSVHATLGSSMDLGAALTLDANLRYVGAYPEPVLPHYYELGVKLAWQATPRLMLSLSGFNLLHGEHREYAGPVGTRIPRSVLAAIRVSFE